MQKRRGVGGRRARGGRNAAGAARSPGRPRPGAKGAPEGSSAGAGARGSGSRRSTGAERKLAEYRRKRDPRKTAEPFDPGSGDGFFVVQKHAASRLHYDFRLAIGGVLVSWAVPKGPSLDPRERRLAVHVEDHPLSYAHFEGTIPKGEYGAGSVIVWDSGPFTLREGSVASGSLKVTLLGRKLRGGWALVRMKPRDGKDEWLLIKERDEFVDPDRDVTAEDPASVLSGLTVEEVGDAKGAPQWNSSVLRELESLPEAVAPRARFPASVGFQKARLVKDVPTGPGWLFEIKLDGVRAMAYRRKGTVRLVTRNDKEVAFRYPEVATALGDLPGGDFVMDGEIVAFDEEGRTRFELLQGRIHLGGKADIEAASAAAPLHYFVFDLPYAEGRRLDPAPLVDRKRVLRAWLAQAPRRLRFSDHVEGRGRSFRDLACKRGLEGVIAKRANAPYRPERSPDWQKIKCIGSQELVIGGFTPPQGGRSHFGSLLLGYHRDGELVYAGKVGTGFDAKTLADVHARLRKLERPRPPFADPPREPGARWVEPRLVAQVEFTEWTSDGKLRHPSFKGLREDKSPAEVVREVAEAPGGDGSPARATGARAPERTPGAGAVPRAARRRSTTRAAARGATSRSGGRAAAGSAQARGRGARRATPDADPSRSAAAARRSRAGRGSAPPDVELTNPGKIFYPGSGITKGDVFAYYRTMGATIVPWLEGRPLTLVRFPNGIGGSGFFQKDQPGSLPTWIPTVAVRSPDSPRGVVRYLLCNDEPTLRYVANLGTIDLHPWASRVPDLEKPDYVVWDLDPPEDGFPAAAAVAPRVREILDRAGLRSFLKTSGGKGLHLYVPLKPENDHDVVRDFAGIVARLVVDSLPRTTTLERSKRARGGKVYVDYLQNGRGKTVVAPWSLRAKEPATVSTPIGWDELDADLDPRELNIRTVPDRVARTPDPWTAFRTSAHELAAAIERLAGRRSSAPRATPPRGASPGARRETKARGGARAARPARKRATTVPTARKPRAR
jgi:bifunctional non-homologous end joining protein LigD